METNSTLIALVGSPNCGKTSLFNALTGLRRKVANYAGVTVERVEGTLWLNDANNVRILDLPGLYSMNPLSEDEAVARDALLGNLASEELPKALVCVVDATNLSLHLQLVLEVMKLGYPMILAVNMMDLAQSRGMVLELEALQQEFNVTVVAVSALRGTGIDELKKQIFQLTKNVGASQKVAKWEDSPTSKDEIERRNIRVKEIVARAVLNSGTLVTGSSTVDKFVLHPILGPLLLVLVLAGTFQAVFNLAKYPMDLIEQGVALLSTTLSAHLPPGLFSSLLVDGVLGGVGSVLVFLPQILLLFAILLILEDSGYLSRASFLLDRFMGFAGLNGKSVFPLMSGFACAIPSILSTRTISSKKARLITIMVAPLMTCSARLPVYALLIAAFIPNKTLLGPFKLQGFVLFLLYAAGVVSALVVSAILGKFVLKNEYSPFILELPPYRWPSVRSLGRGLLSRAQAFLNKAGTFILSISVVMWFISTFPRAPANAPLPAIQYSFAGVVGGFIEPLLRPIGFNWKIGVALVPGFAAREVLVGALGTVYAVDGASEEVTKSSLAAALARDWSLATALSLLAWYVFAPQCLATFAVMQRETRSWKWTLFSFCYLLGLAYSASFVVFHLAQVLLG